MSRNEFAAHVKRTQVHLLLLLAGWLAAGSSLAQTTVEYIHTDALGSVVAVTNEAGQVIERFDYEPYGATIGQPNYGGVGFTGHVQDAATGLTYMQQRYYDPQVGLFLSVDPVTAYSSGDWRQFNRYAYAFNNPYKFTDPDGRCPMPGSGLCGKSLETIQAQDAAQFRSEPTLLGKVLAVALDFTPIAGDIKGGLEAIDNPTPANVVGAVVGLVPIGGDIAKGAIKNGGRVGDFTRAQKNAAKAENAAQNGGKMVCTDCAKGVESVASQKGVPTPGNQAQVHHDPAIKDGGGRDSKAVVLCPECHNKRHNQ